MNTRHLTLSASAAFLALFGTPLRVSAQSILKTAGNYSVLASQAITVGGTGFSIKDGNVGLFPGATSNITGFPPGTVSGNTLLGSAAAIILTGGATQQAEADLQVAATGLAAMPLTADYSNVDMANLGPLPPGVYRWDGAAALTGALVLDAQGHNNVSWVFQFGTGLTTALNSSVTIINAGTNGGSDDGIFWNAATGAIVIGDNNTVLGNYIAYTSVSFTGSTQLLGNGGARFLALTAAVSFAGPGTLNAVGGPGGGDWTGGLTLSGTVIAASGGNGTPSVTIPGLNSGIAGSPLIGITIAATGNPTGYSATGLPPGLVINALTGQISGTPTTSGTYPVEVSVTNATGTTVTAFSMVIAPAYGFSHITNFSARAMSGSGADTLILGFVVSGDNKDVLIRGIGPSLADFGIANFLTNTTLTLYSANGAVDETNSNWQLNARGQADGPFMTATAASVGAFALNAGSMDSALLVTVNNGVHTTGLLTTTGTAGVGLIEIYDVGGNSNASLVNVSARMEISGGDGALIAGFVIGGNVQRTVLIRGIGPTLSTFGVAGALPDPMISVMSGTTSKGSDAAWESGSVLPSLIAATTIRVGGFPLPAGSKDSALVLTLQPGPYTVQVTSVSGSTGVALVEVYDAQ
jgi:hypothetical protein